MTYSTELFFWFQASVLAVYVLTVASCIVIILKENRNPIRSLSWITALIFLPVAGLVFYLFFGRSLKNTHRISRHKKRKLLRSTSKNIDLSVVEMPDSQKNLIKLTYSLCKTRYCLNNRVAIFTDGENKFRSLMLDLENASKYILLQYYIISDDRIGDKISEILMRKAREGVIVKVIYDHVGSFSTSNKFFNRMREAGIDVHPFFRVSFPQLANRINWRNHRKLTIIDGRIGYIGGMNIADRYIYSSEKESAWRDTHFRLEGDIIRSMILSFSLDWAFMGQPIAEADISKHTDHGIKNEVGVQLVTGGPTENWDSLSLCFLKAISSATKSIYIQTPYFLPTDTLMNALESAALAKIDVRVMIPRNCDSKLLKYASYSYVTQCLRAGIKIYFYEKTMLHSKAIIIDDNFVTGGSTNFDFRSLENNFEANLFIYDKTVNREMREIFFRDIEDCSKITIREWHRRPILQRATESVLRLLAPIL